MLVRSLAGASLGCLEASCLSRSAAAWLSSRGFASSRAAAASRVVELQSHDDYAAALKELEENKAGGVAFFTAPWCKPCKMIAPIYDKLSEELPGVRFYKIDIDNEALLKAVEENNVVGVPNFSFFVGAQRVSYFRGAKKDLLLGRLQELQAAGAAGAV